MTGNPDGRTEVGKTLQELVRESRQRTQLILRTILLRTHRSGQSHQTLLFPTAFLLTGHLGELYLHVSGIRHTELQCPLPPVAPSSGPLRLPNLMIPPFDIFRVEMNGHLVRKDTAETLELARLRIKILMVSEPVDYIIHSRQTGHKMLVSADGSTERIP